MSEEEIEAVEWIKKVINYYKKDIEDCGPGLLREETLEKHKTILNIIEKQKEKEINLKKELMKQDELIEKLSRELRNRNKRKIYIRRNKR